MQQHRAQFVQRLGFGFARGVGGRAAPQGLFGQRQQFRPRFDSTESLVTHRELPLTQMIDSGQKRSKSLGIAPPFPAQERWEHSRQQSDSTSHQEHGGNGMTIHETDTLLG